MMFDFNLVKLQQEKNSFRLENCLMYSHELTKDKYKKDSIYVLYCFYLVKSRIVWDLHRMIIRTFNVFHVFDSPLVDNKNNQRILKRISYNTNRLSTWIQKQAFNLRITKKGLQIRRTNLFSRYSFAKKL